jgi:hypothetical protein
MEHSANVIIKFTVVFTLKSAEKGLSYQVVRSVYHKLLLFRKLALTTWHFRTHCYCSCIAP